MHKETMEIGRNTHSTIATLKASGLGLVLVGIVI